MRRNSTFVSKLLRFTPSCLKPFISKLNNTVPKKPVKIFIIDSQNPAISSQAKKEIIDMQKLEINDVIE